VSEGASAQPWSIPARVRALERTVVAQAERITTLEQRVTTLDQTVVSLQAAVSSTSARLGAVETALRYYSVQVDCDAGGSLATALGAAPATAPSVHIAVSGTCREAVEIRRDHVSIWGNPAATIEAPPGSPWAFFLNGQDIRLDQLTVRAPTAILVRHSHLEGSGLHLVGGIQAAMNSLVRLYAPVVIEAAPFEAVAVYEESAFTIFGCDIRDAGSAGVRVENSTFHASNCRIERSGDVGVMASHGANVDLEEVSVAASANVGVSAGLGSTVRIQEPAWRDGEPIRSRITGSAAALKVWSGSSVRLGHVTIDANADGILLGDSSVVERNIFGQLQVTGNSAWGVLCDAPPAVPQLVNFDSSSVFGNAGGDIGCAGY